MRGRAQRVPLATALFLSAATTAAAAPPRLEWSAADSVALVARGATLRLGGDGGGKVAVLRFPDDRSETALNAPPASASDTELRIPRSVNSAGGVVLDVERHDLLQTGPQGVALVETLTLRPSQPLSRDVEIEIPFAVRPAARGSRALARLAGSFSVVRPMKNGWARSSALSGAGVESEYRLGHALTTAADAQLALPLVRLDWRGGGAMIGADPGFSAWFGVRAGADVVTGSLRFRYAASLIPIGQPETRTFVVWLSPDQAAGDPFAASLDAWFRLALSDVPPGPAWLHDIALVGYDFLSDEGQGWERDVRTLAGWLKPEERPRVALCLHGWYDALGAYCFDAAGNQMRESWTAFARTRKVRFTQAELKRRLNLAREQGFRVLLYFADGLAADSGVAGYHDDWAYRDPQGRKIAGWQGPDTFGPTYLLNPAHPEVARFFTNYLAALLQTYGPNVDGFVWDETFHARAGQVASQPQPAYCDRAMLALVKALTAQVGAFDREKVFLASDCIGVAGWEDVPGYAMVADGTYQDSHCDPAAWSYGLFPNWRNTLWSCNWDDVTSFHNTRWGVEAFGGPVAISNGWGDDRGPSEWRPRERDQILRLFRERRDNARRPTVLREDPATILASAPDRLARGDLIPQSAAGETNWALAAHGSRATASSEDVGDGGHWPPGGVIDGRQDEAGWGTGHGWASRRDESLPQWLEIDLGQPRAVRRFVVVAYHKDGSAETAGKWGIRDYQIEAWNDSKRRWDRVVNEERRPPVNVRVHELNRPLVTARFRIVISEVAPLDGQARLLQVEAWGRGS